MGRKKRNNDNYIVYGAHHKGVCMYVGRCIRGEEVILHSGVSSVYEANQFHFKRKKLVIQIFQENLTAAASLKIQNLYIKELDPDWNDSTEVMNAKFKMQRVFTKEVLNNHPTAKLEKKVCEWLCKRMDRAGEGKFFSRDMRRDIPELGVTFMKKLMPYKADEFNFFKHIFKVEQIKFGKYRFARSLYYYSGTALTKELKRRENLKKKLCKIWAKRKEKAEKQKALKDKKKENSLFD